MKKRARRITLPPVHLEVWADMGGGKSTLLDGVIVPALEAARCTVERIEHRHAPLVEAIRVTMPMDLPQRLEARDRALEGLRQMATAAITGGKVIRGLNFDKFKFGGSTKLKSDVRPRRRRKPR